MANYVNITKQMNRGTGVGARHVGVPGFVYRVTSASNGDVIQTGNQQFQLYADRAHMKKAEPAFESSEKLETFWFELLMDGNHLQLGDIWVINDQYLNAGFVTVDFNTTQFVAFCIAANPPVKHLISARLDTTAQFYRSNSSPTTETVTDLSLPYWDSTLPQSLPVICTAGTFAIGAVSATASKVPIGSMPLNNSGDIYSSPTANVSSLEHRRIYVPPLPGFTLIPGDEMVIADGSRYRIISNYFQNIGTVGGQYMTEKVVSGSAQ